MNKRRPNPSPYVFPGLKVSRLPKYTEDDGKSHYVSPNDILNLIAREMSVSVEDVVSHSRKGELVRARNYYYKIMHLDFKYPLKFIGKMVDNRDHTTVLHGINTYKDRYRFEENFRMESDRIYKVVKESFKVQ